MRQPTAQHAPGFTLIEILITISIITVLLSIGIVAMQQLSSASMRSNTRLVLQIAAGAETEYRATTTNTILHYSAAWRGTYAFNAPNATGSGNAPDDDIERFVWAILSVPQSEAILRTANDYLVDTDGDNFLELIDGWDNKMIYRAGYDGINNGSVNVTLRYQHTPFLVSAGADGQWGSFNNATNKPDAQAQDNLYSYEMTK